MKSITINGASDDIIELGGDMIEEFSPEDTEEGGKLAFSDGTVLSVIYDKGGCWRINRLHKGTAGYVKKEADGADTENYSDVVTLRGDIVWCLFGYNLVKAK